jgi:sucrose-6-phosphate hydrolase SacC (GH32 family)
VASASNIVSPNALTQEELKQIITDPPKRQALVISNEVATIKKLYIILNNIIHIILKIPINDPNMLLFIQGSSLTHLHGQYNPQTKNRGQQHFHIQTGLQLYPVKTKMNTLTAWKIFKIARLTP